MKRLVSFFILLVSALLVAPTAARAQNVPIYKDQGGAGEHIGSGGTLTVESGGILDVASGGAFKIAGTQVTASAAQLNGANRLALCLDIADGSADTTYYLVSPVTGTISKIYTVIDGVVGTADITVTGKIGSTAITNGAVTITQSGSAAGDVDEATPTAANTITAGAAMNFVVAGGGSGGSPRIHLVVLVDR